MPNAYTEMLSKDDVTFREFALRCALACGVCVHMRDQPVNEAPRAVPEDLMYLDELVSAKSKLAELRTLTREELFALFEADVARVKKFNEEQERYVEGLRRNYERMQGMVSAWQPPTPKHEGLKSFMQKEIAHSVRSDCVRYPLQVPDEPHAWIAARIRSVKEDIEYYTKKREERVTWNRESKDWIDALYASLGGVE